MSKAVQLGFLYIRLQHLHKALEWLKSAPIESSDYGSCLDAQGHIYAQLGEYDKSIKYCEEALQWRYQNEKSPHSLFLCINCLASAFISVKEYKMAIVKLEEAILKDKEIFGESSPSMILMLLMHKLGYAYYGIGNVILALKTLKAVEEMQRKFATVFGEEIVDLNINMALSFSKLGQDDQAEEYMKRAIRHSHKLYGVNNLSVNLASVYNAAGLVHASKGSNKAVSFFERSLEIHEQVFSDGPHLGKIITQTGSKHFSKFYLSFKSEVFNNINLIKSK